MPLLSGQLLWQAQEWGSAWLNQSLEIMLNQCPAVQNVMHSLWIMALEDLFLQVSIGVALCMHSSVTRQIRWDVPSPSLWHFSWQNIQLMRELGNNQFHTGDKDALSTTSGSTFHYKGVEANFIGFNDPSFYKPEGSQSGTCFAEAGFLPKFICWGNHAMVLTTETSLWWRWHIPSFITWHPQVSSSEQVFSVRGLSSLNDF